MYVLCVLKYFLCLIFCTLRQLWKFRTMKIFPITIWFVIVWIAFPCTFLCALYVFVGLFVQFTMVLFLVGDSVYLHTPCQKNETNPWCVLYFFFPSGSSACHLYLHLIFCWVWLMHTLVEVSIPNYGLFFNNFAGPKWFKNL